MSPPLDKMFLVIALIAMPNLYYKAEYNVPLMLFCFGVWSSIRHHPIIVYLVVFSWLIDAYVLLRTIADANQGKGQPMLVMVLQIMVFALKIIAIIILIIFDRQSRMAIQPDFMCKNCYKTFGGQPQD